MPSESNVYDIAVIGGGIVGLAAAVVIAAGCRGRRSVTVPTDSPGTVAVVDDVAPLPVMGSDGDGDALVDDVAMRTAVEQDKIRFLVRQT